jgi:hypothetical protein
MTTYTVIVRKHDGTVAYVGERLRDWEAEAVADEWFPRPEIGSVVADPEQKVQRGGSTR